MDVERTTLPSHLDAQPRPGSITTGVGVASARAGRHSAFANIPHNAVESGLDDCLYLPTGSCACPPRRAPPPGFEPMITPSSSPIKVFCACCIFLASFFGVELEVVLFNPRPELLRLAFRKAGVGFVEFQQLGLALPLGLERIVSIIEGLVASRSDPPSQEPQQRRREP